MKFLWHIIKMVFYTLVCIALIIWLFNICDKGITEKEIKPFVGCIFCLIGFVCYLIDEINENKPVEKEPEEIEPEEKATPEKLKTDNPENDEIITVTEIKGERNIIIDVVVKIIVFFIGLVLTGFLTSLCGGIIGLLPLIFAIKYCFTTNDKNKD